MGSKQGEPCFLGGRAQPMMAQFAEAGKLTRDDVREMEGKYDINLKWFLGPSEFPPRPAYLG